MANRSPANAVVESRPWNPKDGDLCESRVKPGETSVEALKVSDVQIDPTTGV